MTTETRRVRRDLALGVVLVIAAVLTALVLVPGFASAREANATGNGRAGGLSLVSSQNDNGTNLDVSGRHLRRHGWIGFTAVKTTADLTNTTRLDVRAALASGQTLAEYAAAYDVTEAALVDAIVAAQTERIDAAVEQGWITAEKADELKSSLPERVTERVHRAGGAGDCPGGMQDDSEVSEPQTT